jgi:4-hydroxy-tetrahydrodipicolinate synthase
MGIPVSEHLLATVTAPVVTGFTADGSPDPGATDRLLAHLAAGGIDSLMLFGSNGEGVAVETADVRGYVARTAQHWRDLVGDRATVLVTVTAPATRTALARAGEALAGGADALVVSAPYYYRYTDTELLHHFQRIDALGAAWVAYNIPRYTGNPLSVDLVSRLAELPHCAGIKDSSGDLELLRAFISISGTYPAFGVSQGAENALVAGLQAGAAGITPGLANLAPGACRALFDATVAADCARALHLQDGLNRLAALHAIRPGIAATKAALAVLQLAEVTPAEPLLPFDAEENQRLAILLAGLTEILTTQPAAVEP